MSLPPWCAAAAFDMLFKNKGSIDDTTEYRCLVLLLTHAYKVLVLLSLVMLERVMAECSEHLSDWQAGDCPKRG